MTATGHRRLPHVLTRKDLALVLAPTYAESARVDFEEALERMERAVQAVADPLYHSIAAALEGKRGSEDERVDKLSAGVQARRSRVKPAALTPAVSAVMVLLNVELGFAAETMRETLRSPRGEQLLRAGFDELGAHFVKQLLK